jgi:hypothetical protein
MSYIPTRAELDEINKRIRELVAEGFPHSEAMTQAFEEIRGGPLAKSYARKLVTA